jgi:hypothetical protein
MNLSITKSVLALSLVTLASLAGCAAPTEEEGDANDVKVEVKDEGADPRYTPNVTYSDLRDANASCIGTMCTLFGKTWDCKGGGLCSLAR